MDRKAERGLATRHTTPERNFMIGGLARKLFGSSNERRIRSYQPQVDAINALEPELAKLTDDQLRARTAEFKAQLAEGKNLDDILVPAFATVREAAKRTL